MRLQHTTPRQGRKAKKNSAAPELKRKKKVAVKSVSKTIIVAKTSRNKDLDKVIATGLLAEPGDLPKEYGAPRVVLMPVDPYLANVYWEIDAAELQSICSRLKRRFNHLRPALRFSDLTGDSFDIDIDLQSGNRYVKLANPGTSYFADLGIKTESTVFFPLVRSNTVEIPRIEPQPGVKQPIFVSRKQAARKVFLPHLSTFTGDGSLDEPLATLNEESFSPGISSSFFSSEPEE